MTFHVPGFPYVYRIRTGSLSPYTSISGSSTGTLTSSRSRRRRQGILFSVHILLRTELDQNCLAGKGAEPTKSQARSLYFHGEKAHVLGFVALPTVCLYLYHHACGFIQIFPLPTRFTFSLLILHRRVLLHDCSTEQISPTYRRRDLNVYRKDGGVMVARAFVHSFDI